MFTYALVCAKNTVHGWFQRVFKEQAGGAEVIATLIIIAVVLVLAMTFRDKLNELVKELWNGLMKTDKDQVAKDITLPSWDDAPAQNGG